MRNSFPSDTDSFSIIREIRTRGKNDAILLVRFNSPTVRTSWLQAKKLKGDVRCSNISNDQPRTPVFINQRQTSVERKNLLEARKVIEAKKFHAC